MTAPATFLAMPKPLPIKPGIPLSTLNALTANPATLATAVTVPTRMFLRPQIILPKGPSTVINPENKDFKPPIIPSLVIFFSLPSL